MQFTQKQIRQLYIICAFDMFVKTILLQMNSTKDIVELIEEGAFKLEHWDYQRIANLTLKPDGTRFTADNVRKVLKGMRDNKAIKKIARLYFKRKAKLEKELSRVISLGCLDEEKDIGLPTLHFIRWSGVHE